MNSFNKIISYINSINDKSNSGSLKKLYKYLNALYPNAKGGNYKHQVWEGGYYDHLVECLDIGKTIFDEFIKKRHLPFSFDDVIIVILIHDLEKPIKQNNDDKGKANMDIRKKLCNQFNIQITDKQYNAIKYIHGEGDDYSKTERIMNPLAAFCHILDTISARVFFDEPQNSGFWNIKDIS